MITTQTPADWKDLQRIVAEILSECGFAVEIERKVQTVRGTVEIDVYAEEIVKGRKNIIVCECKLWGRRVHQSIVHSLRTVMGDLGANQGYIISTKGFQSGAITAAHLTNVSLATWEEFQSAFEKTWFEDYLLPFVADRLDTAMEYTEYLSPSWVSGLSEEGTREFNRLSVKHSALSQLIMFLTPYPRLLQNLPVPALPLRGRLREPPQSEFFPIPDPIPDAVLDAIGWKELLAALVPHCDEVVRQIDSIRENDKPR